MIGRDQFIVHRHQVDDFAEGIADLVRAIVQAEHADLVVALGQFLGAGERQDGIAKLDAKLAGGLADRLAFDFLDAVDDGQAQRPAIAVEAAEQQTRYCRE